MNHRLPPVVRLAVVVLIMEFLGALSLGAGLLSFHQSQANQSSIVQLNAALDRAAAAQRSSANATRAFVREINYICEISALRAQESHLPAPPPGVCNLTSP